MSLWAQAQWKELVSSLRSWRSAARYDKSLWLLLPVPLLPVILQTDLLLKSASSCFLDISANVTDKHFLWLLHDKSQGFVSPVKWFYGEIDIPGCNTTHILLHNLHQRTIDSSTCVIPDPQIYYHLIYSFWVIKIKYALMGLVSIGNNP